MMLKCNSMSQEELMDKFYSLPTNLSRFRANLKVKSSYKNINGRSFFCNMVSLEYKVFHVKIMSSNITQNVEIYFLVLLLYLLIYGLLIVALDIHCSLIVWSFVPDLLICCDSVKHICYFVF
jgi:hypothetical protein